MYNYLLYLAYLNKKLEGFFKEQSEYIVCKKGCSKCCQNGQYPFSQIEFDFIMLGYSNLSAEIKELVSQKVRNIKLQKLNSDSENFVYECPFLINNVCCVYDYRGIICRSFGLMSISTKGNSKIPFCAFEGLNYSNVLNPETKVISQEKFEKSGCKNEPLAFNVSYSFLTGKNIEKNFKISFGDKKPLIDWFDEI